MAAETMTLKVHPKAAGSIRRAKARGGLAGFLIAALGSWAHGAVPATVVVHGLEGGMVAYLVCWFAAVTIWRNVVRAEVRAEVLRRQAKARASE
jgi:hypothetical protein